MLIILFLIILSAVIFFGIREPYKNIRFDGTVKYTNIVKVILMFLLNILTFAILGLFIYLVNQSIQGYRELRNVIFNDRQLSNSLNVLDGQISQGTLNQISIPILLIIFMTAILFGAITLLIMDNIYRLISTIIAYKQQNENQTISRLLQGIKEGLNQEVINAYFEMKSNKDKHPLFISQWESIVNILLLGGEIEEAEKLSQYISERKEYCTYTHRLFQSRYKVSLYDYSSLKLYKDRAMKEKTKLSQYKTVKR